MRHVKVVPYDENWPQAFVASSREVREALGANLIEIHHIGSTSVPGLSAKPVIDMLAVVRSLQAVDEVRVNMEMLRYEAMGECGIPGRRYFRRCDSNGDRSHHVHTFAQGSRDVIRHLAFRDYLRAHADVSSQYAELKRSLAKTFPTDIDGYMAGKDDFIKNVERRAMEWMSREQ